MRFDEIGIFWEDLPPEKARGGRVLGPMPPIPETGWLPPREFPNIRYAPWIGIDCETYDPELIDYGPGWARGKGHIVGVSIATPEGKWYFPIRHEVQAELNIDPERFFNWLRFSLAGTQPKIGAHIMYDIGWLAQEGVEVNGTLHDVQYAEGLIDETARVSLETLGWKYIRRGKESTTLKEWIMDYYRPPERYWRREIYRSPVTLTGPYAEEDAAMPYEILVKQWGILVNRGLLDLYTMECKLIRILIAMRFAGITVDLKYAETCRADFLGRADILHKELEHTAGCEININAGDSIAKAFDKLSIPYGKTRTGRPSFTADFLKISKDPISKLILSERKLRKLISTFIDGYILGSHVNGKVYCQFHPMIGEGGGAKTGRFSSSDPNLQNIPIRTPEGKLMRALFTYDLGHRRYRTGDYSQIEYRLLAHFATGEGADEVRAAYNQNPKLDYHVMIGGMIHSYTHEEMVREVIKTLNFAMVYGVGLEHLAEMLGVSIEVAKNISKSFHLAVPFARSTMNAISTEVGKSGVCTTVLNRQTHFDLWEPEGYGKKGYALPYEDALLEYGSNIRRAYLYAALNYKLQGSAADVMKKAMVDCWESGVFAYTGVPRLTVHDELGFSDPGNVPEDAWDELTRICETTIPFSVPLQFKLKPGDNWMEAK